MHKIKKRITNQNKLNKGFTIVELLIVLVVIGILASISIVAYNGIQQRANRVRQDAALNDYVKILTIYEIKTGKSLKDLQTQWEIIGSWTSNLCLGKPEDYPGGKAPMTGTVVEPSACLTGIGRSQTYLGTLSAHIEDISGITLPSIKNLFPGTNWYGLTLTSSGVAYMIPESQGCLGTDNSSYVSNRYLGCTRILN